MRWHTAVRACLFVCIPMAFVMLDVANIRTFLRFRNASMFVSTAFTAWTTTLPMCRCLSSCTRKTGIQRFSCSYASAYRVQASALPTAWTACMLQRYGRTRTASDGSLPLIAAVRADVSDSTSSVCTAGVPQTGKANAGCRKRHCSRSGWVSARNRNAAVSITILSIVRIAYQARKCAIRCELSSPAAAAARLLCCRTGSH